MSLGDNILKKRKEAHLSQEKLAEKVGVTRQTISNWELNETCPTSEQLKSLSKILNYSIDELLDNNINIVIQKVNNTEKLIKKQIKYSKIIFITLYFILTTILISYTVYTFNRKDFTDPFQVYIECTDPDGYIAIINTIPNEKESGYIIDADGNEYYAGITPKEVFENLNIIKKIFIRNGYICI